MQTIGIQGQQVPPVEWRGSGAPPDNLVAFPSDDELDYVSNPEFYSDTVSVPVARLHEVAASVGRPDPE